MRFRCRGCVLCFGTGHRPPDTGVGHLVLVRREPGRSCAEPASRPSAPRSGGGAERSALTAASTRARCLLSDEDYQPPFLPTDSAEDPTNERPAACSGSATTRSKPTCGTRARRRACREGARIRVRTPTMGSTLPGDTCDVGAESGISGHSAAPRGVRRAAVRDRGEGRSRSRSSAAHGRVCAVERRGVLRIDWAPGGAGKRRMVGYVEWSAYSATGGQAQTRLRSPWALSMRPTAGQNLSSPTNGRG